jgi:type IV pilus assembly protein PilY1
MALAAALVAVSAMPASAQAVIQNGAGVALGVNTSGNLNVSGAPISTINSGSTIGVAFFTDYDGNGTNEWGDATAPGCLCEGWGVSAGAVVGRADIAAGGVSNLTGDSFSSTASTAVATVHLTSLAGLSIKHDYHPSASAALFEATVTITNTTGAAQDVRYRRVMDWDIPPTTFSELVTLQGVGLGTLLDSCDDGFETPNPLAACSGILFTNANAVDSGPTDHGASFTFNLGSIADGASKSFNIYYGAAGTEAAALAALTAVGANQIYSFGQNSGPGGGSPGTPATFIFGFAGAAIGVPPPVPGAPEPGLLMLLGSGLAAAAARRYRRA